MTTSLGNRAAGLVTDTSEEVEDENHLGKPITPRHCCPPPGISVLEKLIKTCPVWLQLSISQEKAVQILCKEPVGIFIVRKDENLKNLLLSVHFPALVEASDISEYRIKEEKSLLYLEGSFLVFEDIFKLIAFYCVSRDLLPSTLKLPQAILEANSVTDLETISSLEIGFWDSALNQRRGGQFPHSVKGLAFATAQAKKEGETIQCFASSTDNCSCEIELSIGNDRLWFVNPIFIEERSNQFPPDVPLLPPPPPPPPPSLETCRKDPSFTSDTVTRPPKRSPSRRPPPPPPLPLHAVKQPEKSPMTTSEELRDLEKNKKEMKTEVSQSKEDDGRPSLSLSDSFTTKRCIPPSIPPRRCISERYSGKDCFEKSEKCPAAGGELVGKRSSGDEGCISCAVEPPEVFEEVSEKDPASCQGGEPNNEAKNQLVAELQKKPSEKSAGPPIPPPRKKRISRQESSASSCHSKPVCAEESELPVPKGKGKPVKKSCSNAKRESKFARQPLSFSDLESSHDSLDSPVSNVGAQTPASEPESYSTSSTEDELELVTSPSVKKTRSMILGRAKNRLSMVSLSNVFTAFLSADRKLQKKIVELAQDKDSYFGRLVQDYKVYSLEMMARQSSSTEMLQEIRLMMTQLKSYLVQSREIKTFMDQAVHTDEQLEVIVESALHKCVLKPLKDAINTCLREIHSKDGSFKLLKENQQVIQNTTTTDLGVTTSVPESTLLEKILHKFTTMHKAYSPEKKISILLKSCKLIYDSMTQGNQGKLYGADDFLPVLMYVLARSDLPEVLLNVEYMMELMDPALQLGEGSYYLITTYGAVELIKSYDKITVTRQLSSEVQDSIHRWERRRTLNKARASRSSVQDFITISFMEAEANTRTLAYRTDSTTHQLNQQCAEKFEVPEPQNYGLFVQVDDKNLRLDDDALPHRIKSHLLSKEPKPTFHFIYKEMGGEEPPVPIIKDPDVL
ncbi:ras and Rab interactor 3 isoform X1 [Podarcis raffonei]|uniref:ras and Rab interactor 3 isoform X1 n=1 Tax=Podarcis raffonei TaxID=65483 RepID=UPI00232916BD|nr:ras and Rab interactor 3 isoform X1 [Podarcis raffonei]